MVESLDAGLRALELISRHRTGIAVSQLAENLDTSTARIEQLIESLVSHGLVAREDYDVVRLGGQIVSLAARFAPMLHQAAESVLWDLAGFSGASCFVAVADGDQCVVVSTAEPVDLVIRVGYRVGSRHALSTGAAGIAILALRPPSPDDSADVCAARERGYALTRGHLESGAMGLAAGFHAIQGPGVSLECSVGLVSLDGLLAEEPSIVQVRQAASRLAQQ